VPVPTLQPTVTLTYKPTLEATRQPTVKPTVWGPTLEPMEQPTQKLIFVQPSEQPSAGMGQSHPGFQTTFQFQDVPEDFKLAFFTAGARWDSILTGDLDDVIVDEATIGGSLCSNLRLGQVIDDVLICANIERIDAEDGISGYASPEFARFVDQSFLTSIGFMW